MPPADPAQDATAQVRTDARPEGGGEASGDAATRLSGGVTLDVLLRDNDETSPTEQARWQLRERLAQRRLDGQAYTVRLAAQAIAAGNLSKADRVLQLAIRLGDPGAIQHLHDVRGIVLVCDSLGSRPHTGRGFACKRCQGKIFAKGDLPSGMCLRCRFLDPDRKGSPQPS